MGKCGSKTKLLPALVAWTLLLSLTSLYFYYPCAQYYVLELEQWWVCALQSVLTLFLLVNFCLATFLDPGVIPRASPDEDRDDDFRAPLYRNVEINGVTVRMKWCLTCQFYRPPRCSHCSVCNVCIEVFDHHCPWVNNCIGRRNYRYFFLFLISLSIHMIAAFVLCLIHVVHNRHYLSDVAVIVSIVTMAVIALLIIPVLGLTGFHTVLVARGRTTNEQVTGKFRGGFNPYSRGCWLNCCYALCGPNFPSLRHPSRFVGRKPRKYTIPARPMLLSPQSNAPNNGRRHNNNAAANTAGNVQQVLVFTPGSNPSDDKDKAGMVRMMLTAEDASDLDEPMGSQSMDVEAPLTHNTSKSNFFDDQSTTNLLTTSRTGIKCEKNQPSPASPNFQPPKYPTMMPRGIRGLDTVELRPLSSSSSSRFASPPYANHTLATSNRRGVFSRPDHISIEGNNSKSNKQDVAIRPVAVQSAKRYSSDGELLERTNDTSPQQSFYIWNEPPPPLAPAAAATSPQRHPTYASQVGYFLQHQPQQPPVALQSGGPRTTPSGYPGGPVVPSGAHRGYTTTGRSSVHQQPSTTPTMTPASSSGHPMSFTRALEVSESLNDGRRGSEEEANRESVYDLNSYEISV